MTLRMRRFLGQFALSAVLLLLLVLHANEWLHLGFVDLFDRALYDLKVQATRPNGAEERITIVDIDDKSLLAEGRWPWPREKTARLTANLFGQYGAAAVGFDVVFSEPDRSSGLTVLEDLAKGELAGDEGFRQRLDGLRPRLDYDALFAQALAKGPSVLGMYFNQNANAEQIARLPRPLLSREQLGAAAEQIPQARGYGGAIPRLLERAFGAGHVNALPDADGVVRRMPLLAGFHNAYYGGLSLNLVRAAYGVQDVKLIAPGSAGLDRFRPYALALEGMKAPFDDEGGVLVPYRAAGAYHYVSATDVIHGRVPAAELEGRIILVGTTAAGLSDIRATPVSRVFPGVEIHASVISGILDDTIKWKPRQANGIMTLVILGVGLILALALPFVSPIVASVSTLAMILAVLGVDYWLWTRLHVSLPIGLPVAAALGIFVLNMSWGFFVESRAKGQITRLFGQYIPPELVEEMSRDPDRYTIKGQSREMSVLFSDIRDFTSISEKLEAVQLAEMLNFYLTTMTRVVQVRRGTIDKYIGDAIMAFWGAPIPGDGHARDAVLAALDMQTALVEINPQLLAHGWPEIRIGVGVNSGRMSVGNMGSEFRMAYTVMADAVNLASRLESLTKQYGVGILAGEQTVAQTPDIEYQRIDQVRVKGKQVPVTIYLPLGLKGQVDEEKLRRKQAFEEALDAYYRREWTAAEAMLNKANKAEPAKLHEVYLERIAYYREHPPALDWDGAFTFTTK